MSESEELVLGPVHHVNFTAEEPETSAGWWIRVLGLETGWEMEDVAGRGRKVVILVPNSTLRIVFTEHQSNPGGPASEFRTGLDHIAFTVPDRATLERWAAHLDNLGIPRSEIKEGATGWLITLRDPDNVQIELYTASK